MEYQPFYVPDEGFDIGSYFLAAAEQDYKYSCFFNSYSIILDHEWLAKMYNHLKDERTGLVGASGSGVSIYSHHRFRCDKPSGYSHILDGFDLKKQRKIPVNLLINDLIGKKTNS